ncbi:hypothetical protein HY631_02550 [Candidatus Uhrbacteria bacterium]|nr:hypothetical protein [Candidatus Uhrbacteria bacterium]
MHPLEPNPSPSALRKADAAKRWGGWLLVALGVTLLASFAALNTRFFSATMNLLGLLTGVWFSAEGLEAFWRKRMPTILGEMTGKVAQGYGVLVVLFGTAIVILVLSSLLR